MLRLITCQHATLLLEQQAGHAVPPSLRTSLWLHLRYCPLCHRYARQTLRIAEWARTAAATRATTGPPLPEAAKERMRQRLAAS